MLRMTAARAKNRPSIAAPMSNLYANLILDKKKIILYPGTFQARKNPMETRIRSVFI